MSHLLTYNEFVIFIHFVQIIIPLWFLSHPSIVFPANEVGWFVKFLCKIFIKCILNGQKIKCEKVYEKNSFAFTLIPS